MAHEPEILVMTKVYTIWRRIPTICLIHHFGFPLEGMAEGERRAAEFVAKPTPATAGAPSPIMGLKGGGSGFFITADGFLLTSFHVVANANRVLVKTRAGVVPTVVKADPINDLAVLILVY